VPDDQLEEETDRVTRRSASFDKLAIAEIKAFVDAITLPDDPELPPGLSAFFASTDPTHDPGSAGGVGLTRAWKRQ